MVSTVEQPLFFPNLDDTITPVDVFATFNVIGGGVRYEVRVTAIGKDYNNYGDWSQVVPVTSVNFYTVCPHQLGCCCRATESEQMVKT